MGMDKGGLLSVRGKKKHALKDQSKREKEKRGLAVLHQSERGQKENGQVKYKKAREINGQHRDGAHHNTNQNK